MADKLHIENIVFGNYSAVDFVKFCMNVSDMNECDKFQI